MNPLRELPDEDGQLRIRIGKEELLSRGIDTSPSTLTNAPRGWKTCIVVRFDLVPVDRPVDVYVNVKSAEFPARLTEYSLWRPNATDEHSFALDPIPEGATTVEDITDIMREARAQYLRKDRQPSREIWG